MGLAICLFAMLLVACGSVQEHRSRQFAKEFREYPTAVQQRLLDATIAPGDSTRAVYVALGSPIYQFRDPAGQLVWVYWGTAPESASAASVIDSPFLHFLSRSELRLPGAGEERQELRVTFKRFYVASWTLGPVELERARQFPRIPMGTYPLRR